MRNVCASILSATNSGTVTSAKIDANQLFAVSFVANFTDGAAAGTLQFQISNDPTVASNVVADFTPTNWVIHSVASVSAGAGIHIFAPQICFRWMRLVWISSGGAGTMVVNMNALSV